MADRFIQQTFSSEGIRKVILDERFAKVVMSGGVARANHQRRLEVRNRAVQFAALQEKIAEIVMCRIVVSGNRQRVVPERLAVFPVRCLNPRAQAQSADAKYRSGPQNCALMSPQACQMGRCPCNCYV